MRIRYDKCWVSVEDPNKYYVYAYYDEKGIPFYIGKGKGFRVNHHMKPSSRKTHSYKNHKINKLLKQQGYVRRDILAYFSCEKDAYSFEEFLISHYGLSVNGGLLTNALLSHNDVPAHFKSKETKARVAKKLTKYSERDAMEMIDLYYHRIYTQKEISEIYNISSTTVGSLLCGDIKTYQHLDKKHKKKSLNNFDEFVILSFVILWQNRTPIKQIQADFNISKTHLYRLIRNYLGVSSLQSAGDGTSTDATNIDSNDGNLDNSG